MSITFNSILQNAGINIQEVRLIRHKDSSAKKGLTPYELWRENRSQFELYQSIQSIENRNKLNTAYWAVFIVDFEDNNMFAGLYSVKYTGLLKYDTPKPHSEGIDQAGTCDFYILELTNPLSDLIGRLFIDWGKGALAWIQYAHKNDKGVTEISKEYREPDFPGYLNLIMNLSKLGKIPTTWVMMLQNARGIYLLTCPKTKEQYVGSAYGINGFWGRWLNYLSDGHGDNVMLKSREASDYQVSILEVAGSSASNEDILKMECRWKEKLQSREMGLNKN
jgi:hypothetical protein